MSESDPVERQKAFYASRAHHHLQVRDGDRYARKLADTLASALGIGRRHRVLELGAGFGRFTMPLLDHCGELVALDVSRRVLEDLERTRDARGIPAGRCRTLCRDVHELAADPPAGAFDFVVGFFFLHHLPDPPAAIRDLAGLLTPGGGMGFVEPNRRNPLFLLQIACCPDMTWQGEKGMFRLSRRGIEAAYRAAGLASCATRRFGFFPPQILNRWRRAEAIEGRLERVAALRGLLPFLLLSARRPPADAAGTGTR